MTKYNSSFAIRYQSIRFLSGFILLLVMSMMPSCKKGELEKATPVASVDIKLKTTDPDSRYLVFLDGDVISDTLNNEGMLSKLIALEQKPQHLEVREIGGNVLFDTTIIIQAPRLSLFLYQVNAGDPPLVLSGQDNDPFPGADSVKWRFIYMDQNLPETIKLRYYYIDAYTFITEKFDSVVIPRGQLSRYTTASLKKYSSNIDDSYWGIEIENAATGDLIQKMDLNTSSPRFLEGLLFEIRPFYWLSNKKQTHLLNFGASIYGGLPDTYYGRFLIGE